MSWESFGVVAFDRGVLLQDQTRIAKPKSAYNSKGKNVTFIGIRGLQCETNL